MHHALLHKPDADACNDGTQVNPATPKAGDAGTAKKVHFEKLRFWMQLKIIRLLLLFFCRSKKPTTPGISGHSDHSSPSLYLKRLGGGVVLTAGEVLLVGGPSMTERKTTSNTSEVENLLPYSI